MKDLRLNLTWMLKQVSLKSIRCYFAQKTINSNWESCKCRSYVQLSSSISSLCNPSMQLSNQTSCSTLLNTESTLKCHLITWNQLAQHVHHMVIHTLLLCRTEHWGKEMWASTGPPPPSINTLSSCVPCKISCFRN